MVKGLLFIYFFLLQRVIKSQNFLEEFRLLEITPANILELANIARNNNGGCSFKANELSCIVADTAQLEKVKSEMQAKAVKFIDTISWETTIVSYEGSFGAGVKAIKIDLYICYTQVFDYYLRKIEKKISQLTEDICRDSPDDCDIKVSEPCDKGGDCLAAAKTELRNKSLITDATYQLLNRSKDLLLNDANKKDKTLGEAFTLLKKKASVGYTQRSLRCNSC